jgi:hypothetical protein
VGTFPVVKLLQHTLVVLAAAALLGCNQKPQEKDKNMPLLTGLLMEGVAQDNNRVLLFSVDFRDEDRDLSQGTYTPLINGEPGVSQSLPLKGIFLKRNLPLDATTGKLEIELEVKIPDDNRPAAGSTFDVGIQVQDGAGHLSNIPTVTVEITY